ncbi:MAG: hypothetical protein A2W35_02560 [Chloroflexi bacterium RBG_16_57_11]|nr:MAG: hypothetical protein A2W35_02560 [Chloroflexi bacterium RBG_16_57_11]
MNFLFRFVLFLVRSFLLILVKLLFVLFWLLRPFVLAAVRSLGVLLSMSLAALVHGPGQFTERIAGEWTRTILNLGVSSEHLDRIYKLCRFLAGSMIVLGWAVAVLISLAILRIVFGIFT